MCFVVLLTKKIYFLHETIRNTWHYRRILQNYIWRNLLFYLWGFNMTKLFTTILLSSAFVLTGCDQANEAATDASGAAKGLAFQAEEAGTNAVEGAQDMAETAVIGSKELAAQAADVTKEAAANVAEGASDMATTTVDGSKELAADAVDAVQDAGTSVAEGASDMATQAVDTTESASSDVAEGTKDVASSAVDSAQEQATEVAVDKANEAIMNKEQETAVGGVLAE